jgi:hypothetical protein
MPAFRKQRIEFAIVDALDRADAFHEDGTAGGDQEACRLRRR